MTSLLERVKSINIKDGSRCTAEEMDEQRQKNIAYEYLCHLEEAKKWMESMLKESLPPCTELEEFLRNGIALAKLGNLLAPDVVPKFRIYDIDFKRYNNVGLQFRHTDNISYWIKSLNAVNLPKIFHPETTDLYDKKNMPKVIFCIHALGIHLFKLGRGPLLQDLYGKIEFSDDVIKDKSTELQQSGVAMPVFQGIGRMLGCASSVDSAVLHDAIVAVNNAIDLKDANLLMEKLRDSKLNLLFIKPEYAENYLKILTTAKNSKMESALNRSLNDSHDQDEYDNLLTQADIQGHITYINVDCKWNEVLNAMKNCDSNELFAVLKDPCLELFDLKEENKGFYAAELQDHIEGSSSLPITSASGQKELLQNIITAGNKEASIERKRSECVNKINDELTMGSAEGFSKALHSLEPLLPRGTFIEFALPLYYEEMKVDIIESGEKLGYSDVVASLRVLTDIALVSAAIDIGCPDQMWDALTNPTIHVYSLLEPELKLQYWRALTACRQFKTAQRCFCTLLCYMDIHDCVALVNEEHRESGSAIASLQLLNNAVKNNDVKKIGIALENPALKISEKISPRDLPLLLNLLKKQCEEQAEGTELWLVDIQEAVQRVSREAREVTRVAEWLAKINHALESNDMEETMSCINSQPDLKINNKDSLTCFITLQKYKCLKEKNSSCFWTLHCTTTALQVYLSLHDEKLINYKWNKPHDVECEDKDYSSFLTLQEIEFIVYNIKKNNMNNKSYDNKNVEEWLIRLQARSRGYLVRKQINSLKLNSANLERQAVKIQVGLHEKNENLQRWWRKYRLGRQKEAIENKRRKLSSPRNLVNNRSMEYKITKVQSLWRGRQARKKFLSLVLQSNPSYKVVQRCVHLLEFSTEDYQRELQLQTLKAEVMQTIRRNNELAKQLEEMDVTIGLLIENRITLQNVIAAGKRMNDAVSGSGLKALCASSRRQLSAYQHLFYTLQTSPHYLAKLLFCVPQSRFSKFLKIVILTLFNFQTTSREEYLLLKLFQHALHEEVRCKISKPTDVVCGDPLVLNLAVNYARQHSGQNTLRNILGPVVLKVLNNKHLSIDTNPVNIYNKWRNEIEMDTGKPSDLPYPVNQDQALSYREVRKRLDYNINMLKSNALTFLNHIMHSKAAIPYGLLFIARELSTDLKKKFPDVPEKEVLKVIGNLIYYRFINAAIVAPDAFDIIGPDQAVLSNTQRHNLASIAKILQFAASKKGFGDESPHLLCLNPFLVECHEEFKKFLRSCCDVEDVERHFSITEFTEAALMNPPTIHVTLQELREMHKLLVEYADQIAPDPHDILHELLADLGPVPTAAQLIGYVCDDVSDSERHLAQTQVCLTLTSKFDLVEDDQTDVKKLFIKTKELLVQVLPFLSGHNLPGGLRIEPTREEEEGFLQFQQKRLAQGGNQEGETVSGLRECKAKLRKLLMQLEDKGIVSREDGYQTIISSIGSDILNKGRYRVIQQQELQTVRAAKNTLNEKTKFYEDKVKFYNEYISKCLENISQSKRDVHTLKHNGKHKKVKSKLTLKYTGLQLKEKGVVVSIEGLPASQFKNVLFEITPSENVGIFNIKGKFMGVEVETVEINIQKLLQLQYEGIGVMDIFGKAKININLLLYLLNKKFYC